MRFNAKKAAALVLAGMMSFGVMAATADSTASAARHHHEKQYQDGTSNEYSHRMKEENERHKQATRVLRYQYRQDGNQKQYEREMTKEQRRHDKTMREIKSDYEAHARHTRHRK